MDHGKGTKAHLPRDLRALAFSFPSPPVYSLLSRAYPESPQGTSDEERGPVTYVPLNNMF